MKPRVSRARATTSPRRPTAGGRDPGSPGRSGRGPGPGVMASRDECVDTVGPEACEQEPGAPPHDPEWHDLDQAAAAEGREGGRGHEAEGPAREHRPGLVVPADEVDEQQ